MATNSKITALKAVKAGKNSRTPPSHLKSAGRNLWTQISETFEFEEHDFVLLHSLCETLDRKNLAEKDLRKHGSLTFENRHGEFKSRPEVQIIKDCNILLARLRRELNLSEEDPADSRPPRLRYGGPK